MTADDTAENDPGPSTTESKQAKAHRPSAIVIVVAVAVLLLYGWFVWYMVNNVDREDAEWSRLALVFTGVEAIVFAAAGWLFGTEVQRRHTESAESAASIEKGRADDNETDAEVLQALLATLEARKGAVAGGAVPSSGVLTKDRARGAPGREQITPLDVDELLAVAASARTQSLARRRRMS